MNLFRVLSIKKKLTLIIMLISSVALLLACITFIVVDVFSFKDMLTVDLMTVADILAKDSVTALIFDDKFEAAKTLEALKAEKNITAAAIFGNHGELFASYLRDDMDPDILPEEPRPPGHAIEDDQLVVSQEMIFDNRVEGTLHIQSDLDQLYSRVRFYAVIVIVVLIISSLAAFWMTANLQKIISRPILHLAKMAKLVSEKKNFSVRAKKLSEDEIGFLTERFNEMLSYIQERDTALRQAHTKLEKQAKKLKKELRERKLLQKELERAQRLEAAGRVAGQIAHDFNNLLGPLAAYPTLIRQDINHDHRALEMVDEMEVSAKKIAEINQQLLSLGRRGHYNMQPVNLNEVLRKVISSQPPPEQITIETELANNLSLIMAGEAQLSRAITNLLVNAYEAIDEQGEITIKTENVSLNKPLHGFQTIEPGEYVKIEISDTGGGIAPELLDKIFDPFFTTKTMDRMRGSGLGLSVVHGIVEDHKGCITVNSKVGEGTAFALYFPTCQDGKFQVDSHDRFKELEGGSESILVVDDDPVQRKVTGHLLERLGYEVSQVKSGEEAIEFVQRKPQDLLILDMVMDGIDGTETYRRILEFNPNQKAIILSGYAMSRRVEKALKLGAGRFLPKPVTLQILAPAVRKELDKEMAGLKK